MHSYESYAFKTLQALIIAKFLENTNLSCVVKLRTLYTEHIWKKEKLAVRSKMHSFFGLEQRIRSCMGHCIGAEACHVWQASYW